jgi:hypothetical protein
VAEEHGAICWPPSVTMFSAVLAIASESSGPAHMTDDRGVGQAVCGFGGDRPESWQRQGRDAPVHVPVRPHDR